MLINFEPMSSKNSNIITKFADFTYKSFKIRNEVEYVV